MEQATVGMLIGRFQPFHNGHVRIIEQMRRDGITTILVGVGSCQESRTLRNPFSFEERRDMIQAAVPDAIIRPIPDFNNPPLWKEYVLATFPEVQALYSGGEGWTQAFKDKEFIIRTVPRNDLQVSGTMIREKIAKKESIDELIPKEVKDFLEKMDLELAIKEKYKNPKPTVDTIIEYDGKIVIIERKNEPHGYALPGGFVDEGESTEHAAVREAKEETNLDFEIKGLLGVYSDPARDPRQHTISVTYYGKGMGELKAQDDAKNVKLVTPQEALGYNLVFDHEQIVKDYMEKVTEK